MMITSSCSGVPSVTLRKLVSRPYVPGKQHHSEYRHSLGDSLKTIERGQKTKREEEPEYLKPGPDHLSSYKKLNDFEAQKSAFTVIDHLIVFKTLAAVTSCPGCTLIRPSPGFISPMDVLLNGLSI